MKEQIEEMAEMLEIIENAREIYENDVTDHTENEYIREGLLDAGYRRVIRCKDCEYHHWEQEPCHGKIIHKCSVLNAEVFKEFYCYHGKQKMKGGAE